MEDTSVRKSSWSLAIKALLGIACVMALAWLIGGSQNFPTLTTG
jgi:hypothetical protein